MTDNLISVISCKLHTVFLIVRADEGFTLCALVIRSALKKPEKSGKPSPPHKTSYKLREDRGAKPGDSLIGLCGVESEVLKLNKRGYLTADLLTAMELQSLPPPKCKYHKLNRGVFCQA